MHINQITFAEIKRLSAVNLSMLLLQLLNSEKDKYKFEGTSELIVPLRINVADAGDDGRVTCLDTNGSMYVTHPQSVFQNKATDISPSEIFDEFFSSNKPHVPATDDKEEQPRQLKLKYKIKEVLDQGGQYVFFIGHDYNSTTSGSRLAAARRALVAYNELHGTTYAPTQVRIIEGNEIANWTNQFISAVIFVQACNGMNRPAGLQLLTELESYREFRNVKFQSNEILDEYMSQVQASISQEHGSIRIIGHSGLGKTRLVYEAFKTADTLPQAVYFNIYKDADQLIQFVRTYGLRYEGILVVDNCDFATHQLLKDEIGRFDCKFKLVTIDYNVAEENTPSKTRDENYIFLHSKYYFDVVKAILKNLFGERLDQTHLDQIADFSEGYPSMAVLFANARLNGSENLTELVDDDVLEKLAFGRDYQSKDENKLNVLVSCSIFSRFFRPSNQHPLNQQEKELFDKQKTLIMNEICDPQKSHGQFMESTDYFEDRKVLERRGYYLNVRPTPLALKLAMRWWRYVDKEKLVSLFPSLMQANLAIPFAQRLGQLDQLREARQIVNDLWGAESPFGQAEVLNTDLGSRLFRSISSVNPETALQTLESAFGHMTRDELYLNIGPGRREIIWTLEMLCFRAELFTRAVMLLFKFAAAENENISNNATGQLLQLFQPYLAGTEADLNVRLKVIDEHINSPDETTRQLAIRASLRGLKSHGFVRTIGFENQGTGAPLVDYRPNWKEMSEYWVAITDRLLASAKQNIEDRTLIKSGIAKSFRGLFENNLGFLIEDTINRMIQFDNSYWEDAVNQLKLAKKYDLANDDDAVLVDRLIEKLSPVNLTDKLKSFVSVPDWDTQKDEKGQYINLSANNAMKFADTLIESGASLDEILPIVLTGEQRAGFAFGLRLGQLLQDGKLADHILDLLANIPRDKRNPEFAVGYVSSLSIEERRRILEVLLNGDLNYLAVYFTKAQQFEFDDIQKILNYVDDRKIKADQFLQLPYGGGLRFLSDTEFIMLVNRLTKTKGGAAVAMELVEFYVHDNNDRWQNLKDFVRDLMVNTNLLLEDLGDHAEWIFGQMIEKILTNKTDDELHVAISKHIYQAAIQERLRPHDEMLKRVIKKLIETDFKTFWSIVGEGILNPNTYLDLKWLLGTNNGVYGNPGLLHFADYEYIVEWCAGNEAIAAKRIAYMMPTTSIDNKAEWHPLALKMIDKFGDIDGFMNELSANVHSFGSVGSAVPYLRDQQALFSKLIGHPIEKVSDWAKREVSNYNLQIEKTGLEEASDF